MPAIPEPAPELLERAMRGDASARRELLVAHLPLIEQEMRSTRRWSLRERESVSDLSQSVVGDLLPELERARFDSLAEFRGWLRRASRNKLIDKQRYHAAKKRAASEREPFSSEIADRGASISVGAMKSEASERLRRHLARLGEEQRRVVEMASLEGCSFAEIAESLGKTETACRMLKQRALVQLARWMDEEGEGSPPAS